MNFVIFLSLLSVTFSFSRAVSVDCNFKNFDAKFGELYTCITDDFETEDDDNLITEVNGDHVDTKTNENVQQIFILNQKVEYFPGGLRKFFPNLESIVVRKSSLTNIFKSDLAGLSGLKYIDLSGNEIEILGSKLFEDNSKLIEIHFQDNRIFSVSEDILDPIDELKVFHLYNNDCVEKDTDVKAFHDSFSDMKKNLIKKCPMLVEAAAEVAEKQIKKLSNQLKVLENKLEEEARKAKDALSGVPNEDEINENERLKTKIEKLESDKLDLELTVEMSNHTISENENELKNLKEEVENLKAVREYLEENLVIISEAFETLEANFNSTKKENFERISTLEGSLEKTLKEKKTVEQNLKAFQKINIALKKQLTFSNADTAYLIAKKSTV